VQSCHTAADVVRKTLLLAVLGVLAIFLSGPIIAVLSVVLSVGVVVLFFASVGLLVWGLFRLATVGPEAAWRGVRELAGHVARGLVQVAGFCGRVAAEGLRRAQVAWRKAGAVARFAGEIGLVTACGVVIGAGVGAVTATHSPGTGLPVAANAVLGGLIASVVGVWMAVRGNRTAPVHTAGVHSV
jgi:hypothetical protein